MKRRFFSAPAAVLAAIAWIPLACPQRSEAPAKEVLLKALAEPPAAPSKPVATRPPLQIYVDASASMKGFLAVSSGRFRRALDQLLDRSVAGGYEVSVFKFGEQVEGLPTSTSTGTLLQPDFFNGQETSFPTLFRFIRSHRRPGSVAIVVTDLVQSGRTGEQRELSRAFQELAADRPEVLLLALRSPFVGRYSPEARRVKALELKLEGQDPQSSRPFYVLVIADRPEEMEVLRRHLELTAEPGSVTSWEIDASRPAIVVKGAQFLPKPSGPDAQVWQVYRAPEILAPIGRTHRSAFWLVELGTPPPEGTPVRLRLTVDGEIGVKNLADLTIEARRSRCPSTASCEPPQRITVVPDVLRTDKSGDLVVSYPLPRPSGGGWDGYQLRLLPGRANLERPIDSRLWTTDDDTTDVNGMRTYKLDLFVDTLTNALREPSAISEHFIFLGGSE